MDSQIVAVSHPRVGTGASVVADDDARNIHTAALKLGEGIQFLIPRKKGRIQVIGSTLLLQSWEALLDSASAKTQESIVPADYVLYEEEQAISQKTQQNIISTIPTMKSPINFGGHCALLSAHHEPAGHSTCTILIASTRKKSRTPHIRRGLQSCPTLSSSALVPRFINIGRDLASRWWTLISEWGR